MSSAASIKPDPRTLLGVLTPSSNTALEPLTSQLLSQADGVSAHFSRFRVTQITLDEKGLNQFDQTPVLEAARLLADARVDMIGWSGTAAGWLGFEQDQRLCAAIEEVTGIRATSSILALNEVLNRLGISRIALVSPYTDDVQQRIIDNYRDIGIDCVAERHLDISDNFSFSEVTTDTLTDSVQQVAEAAPQAILLYCTNLRSAQLAEEWERRFGIPVIDTTSTVVWKMLRETGYDTTGIQGWGRFFQEAR
ncbi:maleate cis-trans isomerase family protein [Marinobacterium sp. YM272]|uniref:maleate cis-trans isomerase family protein n=1 Tax=Marinobacterium sp. YM272 TaxID=3421654 RepID=UPI003D7F57C5